MYQIIRAKGESWAGPCIYFCNTYIHTSNLNIPEGINKIDNKSDGKFIIMQVTIEYNKKEMKSKK